MNRLTESETKKANMLASMIDCSPHEWPNSSREIQLICHGYLDRVADNQALRERLAAVEAERDAAQKRVQDCETRMMRYAIELAEMQAERDAARAGEARAVEALKRCHEGAARQLAEPRDHNDDQYALTAIATECDAVLAAQGPALDWLAQQRREAAEEALERLEAMKSKGSTMLPKSASVSEEGQ